MTYKQIKWLILILPTITIGVWEYVRHQFLLPYISMEAGNWLTPVIVFSVTVIFLTKLFSILEGIQEELNAAREAKAALEERETIARDLHDGIAQSLFLLSVQVDQLEKRQTGGLSVDGFRKTVHKVNDYVRQAIANLRYPPNPISLPWMEMIRNLIRELEQETGLVVKLDWKLPEDRLTAKGKLALQAAIREALSNVRKHAGATHVSVIGTVHGDGWMCKVSDDGKGIEGNPFILENKYGLKIMKDRVTEMGWSLKLERERNQTVLTILEEAADGRA